MTGRITDSQMIKDSEVLVEQRKFSEADASSKEPFNNIQYSIRDSATRLMRAWRAKHARNLHTPKGIPSLVERLLYIRLVWL